MGLVPALVIGASAIGTGLSIYSQRQASKDAQAAAEFNAKQARNAAKVAADDSRNNALRRQEQHRKYLGSLRAKLLADAGTIEGGHKDFLDETVGDLQLKVMDASAASQRRQANYQNAAFRYDYQAEQLEAARPINTFASALNGVTNIASTGYQAGAWNLGVKPASSLDKNAATG